MPFPVNIPGTWPPTSGGTSSPDFVLIGLYALVVAGFVAGVMLAVILLRRRAVGRAAVVAGKSAAAVADVPASHIDTCSAEPLSRSAALAAERSWSS